MTPLSAFLIFVALTQLVACWSLSQSRRSWKTSCHQWKEQYYEQLDINGLHDDVDRWKSKYESQVGENRRLQHRIDIFHDAIREVDSES